MPITLTITAESSQQVLAEIETLARAPLALKNLAILQHRAMTQQNGAPNPTEPAAEQPAEAMPTAEQVPAGEEKAEPVKRTRKGKTQPTLEGVATAQAETAADNKVADRPPSSEPDPLEIPDFLKKDKATGVDNQNSGEEYRTKPKAEEQPAYDIPKTQEEARKLCGQVISEKGASAMEEIIVKKMSCKKFGEIPVERYGELAGLCHEALAKVES